MRSNTDVARRQTLGYYFHTFGASLSSNNAVAIRDNHIMPNKKQPKHSTTAWDTSLSDKKHPNHEEIQKLKETWLSAYQQETPVYEPTGEQGVFAGLVGYLTGTGLRIFPVYKTPDGQYFYLYERKEAGYTKMPLDQQTTKIHSAEWFLRSVWFLDGE